MKFYKKFCVSKRVHVALMIFFACFMNYMMRVNMSVNIIAMVPDKPKARSNVELKASCAAATASNEFTLYNKSHHPAAPTHLVIQPAGTETFTWTVQEQAYVLAGYFWGYSLTSLVGGPAAEYFGPRKLIFYTMLLSAILTVLSPQAAKIHYLVLVGARIIMGAAGGTTYPALHALVAHWAPPTEKGRFVSALLGGAIGTVFTWSLTGPLIANMGWDYAFYVPGLMAALWCLAWLYFVYDTPVSHPRISEAEKKYVLEALGDKVVQSGKLVPPILKIMTSFPFYAHMILHYGSDWGLYVVLTAGPKFVSTALGFNLTSVGGLTSLPYLARMIFSLLFGILGDKIVKSKKMSTTHMRKFFIIFSHVIPGLLIIALGYSGCTPFLCVALITFSMGSNGAATLTNLVIHQDLAPNFAGTLYGIANGIGNTSGFIVPLITAHYTKYGHGFMEWRPVFVIGALMYIVPACFFIIFGTAETQSWNYVHPHEREEARRAKKGGAA